MTIVQDDVICSAVKILEDVLGGPGKVECLQTKVLQAGVQVFETCDKVIAAVVVVRVPKDLDVGMQGFQSMLGVLRPVSAIRTGWSAALQGSSL